MRRANHCLEEGPHIPEDCPWPNGCTCWCHRQPGRERLAFVGFCAFLVLLAIFNHFKP